MELTADCERRHERLGRVWYCLFGNGEKGLVKKVEEIQEWQKKIEALLNQIKGLKIVGYILSFVISVATVVNIIK